VPPSCLALLNDILNFHIDVLTRCLGVEIIMVRSMRGLVAGDRVVATYFLLLYLEFSAICMLHLFQRYFKLGASDSSLQS
jgi:hypothetical protein